MPLTSPQQAALVADIAIGPFAGTPNNSDTAFEIARYYNQPDPVTFFVWRTSVSRADIMQNGFDWTRVDNASVGKARIWQWMFLDGPFDPSQPNIRDGISEAWAGAGAELQAHRLGIFGHCQQQATRVQRLFATGAGTTTNNAGIGPATAAVTQLSDDDVRAARGA